MSADVVTQRSLSKCHSNLTRNLAARGQMMAGVALIAL